MKQKDSIFIGLDEALELTRSNITPMPSETVDLYKAANRVLATDVYAQVDAPSIDASTKDGYAVISSDIEGATQDAPVTLQQDGLVAAGDNSEFQVKSGRAIRILTGGKIPAGANAVVAEEFVSQDERNIIVKIDAEPGRNILPKGSDVEKGGKVAEKGSQVVPGLLGLLAAAGHSHLEVVRKPTVAIIATGDEVVAPGTALTEGKLYASNITTLMGWCHRYGFSTHLEVVKDNHTGISQVIAKYSKLADAVITSGGAWTGDRDLVAKVLDELGLKRYFHRIRIGPGKAVGFGTLEETPVFILPGGPPSNLIGFLQVGLPGLLKLSGRKQRGLPEIVVQTDTDLTTKFADWTQFIFGDLSKSNEVGPQIFHPLRSKSRLRSMAEAQVIVSIPEGETHIPAGSIIAAQYLGAF